MLIHAQNYKGSVNPVEQPCRRSRLAVLALHSCWDYKYLDRVLFCTQ